MYLISKTQSSHFFQRRTRMITETQNTAERRTLNLWPEAGRMLGLSRPAVYAAAKRGDIPTIKIGGRILVPRAALERLLDCGAQ
jgi:excisionase family DNA binding protein